MAFSAADCGRLRRAAFAAITTFALVPIAFADEAVLPAAPPPDAAADSTLSTHETAVECAMAQIVEAAGGQRRRLANPGSAVFKTGLCTGKMQTYMLMSQERYPDCFPRISLEEAIAIFVRWAEANPALGSASYPSGFRTAFTEAFPCLGKAPGRISGE